MARDLPAGMASAITEKVIRYGCFLEFDFPSGFLRLWSGRGEKTLSGVVYQGAGELLSISPVDETTEVGAAGLTMTMSGLPPDVLSIALTENYRGRKCKFVLALFNEAWEVTFAYVAFGGRMDVMVIEEGAETVSISVKAENRLVDLGRPRMLRYTPAEQQRLFPGDTSMRWVARLAERPLPWGIPQATASSATAAAYGGGSANKQYLL